MAIDWARARWESLLEIRDFDGIALLKVTDERMRTYYCFERPGRSPGQESILISPRQLQLLIAGVERDIAMDDASEKRHR
jgi:hypothetical protein